MANAKSNHSHLGVLRMSNLCCEIMESTAQDFEKDFEYGDLTYRVQVSCDGIEKEVDVRFSLLSKGMVLADASIIDVEPEFPDEISPAKLGWIQGCGAGFIELSKNESDFRVSASLMGRGEVTFVLPRGIVGSIASFIRECYDKIYN
jgi:hypothetical protein